MLYSRVRCYIVVAAEAMAVAGLAPYAADGLKDVHAELSARRPQGAIRRFEQILAGDRAPTTVRLTDWITSSIGREGLSHLAFAYATAPCSHCDRGMRDCSACGGTGRGEKATICRRCVGMRCKPCKSCHGTGFANYGKCPDDLRPLVLSYRLCIAASETAKLIHKEGSWLPETTVEGCLLRVANLNKLAGVLEDAAVEVAGQQARGMISPARLQRVKHRIGKTYHTLESSIRETLERAVELSSQADDQSPDVLFYRWLAHSDKFEGTPLQHDFAARLASQFAN